MTSRNKWLAVLAMLSGMFALATAIATGIGAWRRHAAVVRQRAMDATARRLRAFDERRRESTDFARAPGWNRVSGPDPYALVEIPGSGFLAGILRGADAVVVLDGALREVQRLPAPRGPAALARAGDLLYVAGDLSSTVARFRWRGGALVPAGTAELPGVHAIRGLAAGPGGWLYLVEEERGRLLAASVSDGPDGSFVLGLRQERFVGNGPVRVERVGDRLIVDCILDHALVIQELDPDGRPADGAPTRIVHDGPIWSFAAVPDGATGRLLIAAGGVEDHPLDRTVGAFGYVDSFLYLYRQEGPGRPATRLAAVDVSDHGVVVPKALTLAISGAHPVARVAGYGSDRWLEVRFDGRPSVASGALVPGTSAVLVRGDGARVFADPLLDAWVLQRPEADAPPAIVPVPFPPSSSAPPADPDVRLGEALIFTTLIAPWNSSAGPLSRFTCETCHFEGYADGRTHHTGRGDVHAVTKPLLGLFNNRPHFSRALDPDLVSVAFNEFRVAGARSDHDPWFALRGRDVPWLNALGVRDERLSPERLRRAFMAFLMAFNHRPNPMAVQRERFSAEERAGAAVFRDRCESCHQARLASDVPESRVPFERWEELTLSHDGPIVWGEDAYEKTGVIPYVHPEGARVPSLRRLYKKRPYFTNGTAPDLAAVLERVRYTSEAFWHEDGEGPPPAEARTALDARERQALLAFLRIL